MHCLIQRLEINYIYNYIHCSQGTQRTFKRRHIYIFQRFLDERLMRFYSYSPILFSFSWLWKLYTTKKKKVWKWNLSWEDSIPLLVSCLNVVSTWIFLGFNYKTCLLEVSKIVKSNFTFEWSKAVIKINLTARCCQPDKVTILSKSFHFTQHCTLSSSLARRLDWVPSQMRTKCTIL